MTKYLTEAGNIKNVSRIEPSTLKTSSMVTAAERFGTPQAALKYRTALINTRRHKRECACIGRCLETLCAGSHVLDFPCGTGRLVPYLLNRGFRVSAADSSEPMLEIARQQNFSHVTFHNENILSSSFTSYSFDAILCNRLFHHFTEPEVRYKALRELRRLCKPNGRIVISFFCNLSLSAALFHFKNSLKTQKAQDRIPISYYRFSHEIEAAGLTIHKIVPAQLGISPQWYLALSLN
ncbi:MAG: class I SAM-dependent methyltransferase [Desulfuromonas thiophila]|nr:class I SAM-dependent methyltransferase [Desulfuromonas thiophila]